ncbi:hypothetical protein [Dialister sp.]|uniref:hypothetical protein n=1 Tax=Dialister sp. TaxID=1955814 RepID=UPI002E807A17|nr:hypothetical protein [Dialister sp.]MEE3452386.1 hypothetical protein [Dialister sp.]
MGNIKAVSPMRDSFFDEKVVSEDGARQKMGAPFQVMLAEVYCKQQSGHMSRGKIKKFRSFLLLHSEFGVF